MTASDRLGSIVIFNGDEPPLVLAFLPMVVSDHIQARIRGDEQWIAPEQIFFMLTAAHSAEELAFIRYAAQIGEEMSEAMRTVAKPGVPETALVAAATEVCLRRGGFTAEILIGSGPEYVGWGPGAWIYRPQAARALQEGDIVLSEIFALYAMMESQLQPAIVLGDVHPDIVRAAEVARRSYDAGLKQLRSGNTFGDVVDAMDAPILESGGWHVHPLIHSINPYGPIGFGNSPGLETLPEAAQYGNVGRIPTVAREMPLREGMSQASAVPYSSAKTPASS